MARVEDVLHKMMRRFDANYEHIKELRSDFVGIGQKVDTHAISIKQIELQMAQLSATVNTVLQSLLGVITKPLTHLCRLMRKR